MNKEMPTKMIWGSGLICIFFFNALVNGKCGISKSINKLQTVKEVLDSSLLIIYFFKAKLAQASMMKLDLSVALME